MIQRKLRFRTESTATKIHDVLLSQIQLCIMMTTNNEKNKITHKMKIKILGHDEIVHKILMFYLVALTTLHRVRSGNIIFI